MIFNGIRNRLFYLLLFFLVVISGFLTKVYAEELPHPLDAYIGDSLWGLMVFIIFGILFKYNKTVTNFLISLIFSFGIEFTQLIQHPLLDSIRDTTLGHLILGDTFVATDLIFYSIGILMGVVIESFFSTEKGFI